MVAKGHDIPNVTLVGILSADSTLNLPDFRASERTFALLTQAAGRAGRGDRAGHVVLQTYDPADDAAVWFDKVKALTAEAGFCADMKAYKADPAAWPGSVADVSTFLRIAVTGKTNSPDLYTVMQLLGSERTAARIRAAMDRL